MNTGQAEVVIVTGAGKGVGRACALHLARCGLRVLVNNRSHAGEALGQGSAAEVAAQIRAEGGDAAVSTEDVARPGAGGRLVAQALDTWGRLDMVYANAARAQHAAFHSIGLQELREIIEVGFGSTLEIFHAAWPVMRRQGGGRLLATTSSAGRFGGHGLSAYAASKGAVEALVKSLAIEGARHGIRCNAISPYATSRMTLPHLPAGWAQALDPATLGPVVAWLLSRECPLNGEIVVSGGGRHGRAWSVETAAVDGDLADEAWTALTSAPGAPHRDAGAAFAAFMAGLAPGAAAGGASPHNPPGSSRIGAAGDDSNFSTGVDP